MSKNQVTEMIVQLSIIQLKHITDVFINRIKITDEFIAVFLSEKLLKINYFKKTYAKC